MADEKSPAPKSATGPDNDPKPPTPPAAAAAPPAPAEPDDGKAVYVVTPRAGPQVAGQRVKPQQKIRLSENEARAELLAQTIVPEGGALHEQLRADAKPRKDASKAA